MKTLNGLLLAGGMKPAARASPKSRSRLRPPLLHQRPGPSVPEHAQDDPEADARRGASAAILRQQGQVSGREIVET